MTSLLNLTLVVIGSWADAGRKTSVNRQLVARPTVITPRRNAAPGNCPGDLFISTNLFDCAA